MPIPELPYDLWAHVASFLPSHALQRLRSVHRAFLDLALNEKYRNVEFLNPPGCQCTVNWVKRLRDPFVAQRVKTFCLCPSWFREVTSEYRRLICIYPAHVRQHGSRQVSWTSSSKTSSKRGTERTSPSRRRHHAHTHSSHSRSHHHHHHASHSSASADHPQTPGIVISQNALCQLTNEVISGFTNVYNFAIMSASLGWATSGAPIPSIAPFLDRAWKTFGKNIRQLTINVPLGDWESLFPSAELSSRTADSRGFLPSLEELTIRFAPEMTITNANHETSILSTLVSPFISQFSTHLRKLNFISSAIGDHSGLFKSFASESRYFAKLDTLVLNIAFYPPILSDPSGLMQFMQKHSKILQDVRLLPTESYRLPFGVYLHSAPDATMNHGWTTSPTSTLDSSSVIDQLKKIPYTTFSNWLTQQTIAYPEILHDLQTLVVAPSVPTLYEHPFTPGWNWQAEGGGGRVPQLELKDALSFPVKLVKRSRDTLVNLVLMDRELQYEEIRLVVEALSHRSRCLSALSVAADQRNGGRGGWLKVLRIRISTLSPEIFDLLSKELTELKELEIKFSGLALDGGGDAGDRGEGAQLRGDDHVQDGMVGGPPLREEISPNDFVFRMQLRRYPSWRLSHLRLTPAYLVTSVFEMSIMDQMKICIPSLTYHGQGNEKRKTRTRSYDDSSFDAQMELIAEV